jgi:hypothetical protein
MSSSIRTSACRAADDARACFGGRIYCAVNVVSLGDIIAWAERLQRHVAGIGRATFFESEVIQDAVCRCIEAVGEAGRETRDLAPGLDQTDPDLNLKARPSGARSHHPRLLQARPWDCVGHCHQIDTSNGGGRTRVGAEVRRGRCRRSGLRRPFDAPGKNLCFGAGSGLTAGSARTCERIRKKR